MLILLVVTPVAAETGGEVTPWQQKVPAVIWSKYRSLPRVEHGHFLFFRRAARNDSSTDVVNLYSLADGSERKTPFWINGASAIWVNDAAVTQGEKLFLVGSLLGSRGVINFMAESDIEGHILQTIDMGTYEPERACVDSAGNVWTFGQDWNAEKSDIPYEMLRNYSPTGRLLKSYLSNDTLPPVALNYSTRLSSRGGAHYGAYLRCGNESVGVYVGPALAWAEVGLMDGRFQKWKVMLPAVGRVTGFALLGAGQAYYSFRAQNSVFMRGLFRLDLTKPNVATWGAIDGTLSFIGEGPSSPRIVLGGADGQNLVYAYVPADFPKSDPVFYWFRP